MRLSLHYSPCPNDTFIFHALAAGLVRVPGVDFEVRLADVERLNEVAGCGGADICKVSVAAAAAVLGEYRIRRAGGAMGRGVGPILVGRTFAGAEGTTLEALHGKRVAIPGRRTTANLLFGLLCKARGIVPELVELVYDEVMPAVKAGDCAAGVVIHEGRFTFAQQGLARLLDLGAWWEEAYGLPIPLGCIVMRRSLGVELAGAVDEGIRASLRHARMHPEAGRDYIRQHAQEMDEAVIRQHIGTFVTDHSLEIGHEGEAAILALLTEAQGGKKVPEDVFLPEQGAGA